MKLGLHLPNFASLASPADIADLAARAEAAGWDGFFIWDHVARPEGTFPMAEPWIALTAIATATRRLRIGPLVTPLAQRRPWNVARQVATLDQLTGGRVTLGVGLGVSRGPEFSQFGEESDPRVRGDMLDEGLQILRAAWQGTPVRHAGTHYQVDDVTFLPAPVQSPLPVWGATERLDGRPVRRAAALDGVFPIRLQPADLPALLASVARHRPGGMDGYDVVIADTGDPRPWRDAGATWWLHELPWRQPLSESVAIIEAGPPGRMTQARSRDCFDAVVIGAGIVGAACAYYLARAGLRVAVAERGTVASGTTGAGEGNILISDKEPGPELELARLSQRLWRELGDELGPGAELDLKGGLVVAAGPAEHAGLREFAATQAAAGVRAEAVPPGDLHRLEPHLAAGLAGGVYYPEDMQVQPMMAAALLLRRARELGAELRFRHEVTGLETAAGRVAGVRTTAGVLSAGLVVNAAGTWAGEIAEREGLSLPVLPRRGFIVVTEALPVMIRHKVYTADYVANVASGSAGLEVSTVIEGTASGTVLIGASRERVGFDRGSSLRIVGLLAAQAARLFPVLAQARAIRFYRGFRPYCPDHLPVIGADDRLAGLLHACGHEGAGVGLAPATGQLIAELAAGQEPSLPVAPFRPGRFGASAGA